MTPGEWVWMPHAGHFILGDQCRFHLATYVGGVIVSTVGELWCDSRVREIFAECRGIKIEGRGDEWDHNYMKKIGFEALGYQRKYETMVFNARESGLKCCPYRIDVTDGELDFAPYNAPEDAMAGHMELCIKWSQKDRQLL